MLNLNMTVDRRGETETGRVVDIGETVTYLGHVVGGMIRVRFADSTEGVMHPHSFKQLRG